MASPQSSQSLQGPSQLSRMVSKALRTLGASKDIQCTKSLIQAYNDNDVESVNGVALHHWLDAYVREFAKQRPECMPESWIRDYALLAMIDVKGSAEEELVGRVYTSLRACIKSGEHCPPVIVVALENMLTVMDIKIVKKETPSLISLADDLLCLTDPTKRLFTRDTYAFHMACLLTLERTLIVLHDVECTHSKQWIVDFFQNKLKTQLKAIASSQKYYPFVYNTQLIRCNIDGLIKGNSTDMLLSAGRRIFYALCGGLYLFQGVRELAVMQIDFAAIEAGVLKMQQAFGGMINTWAIGLKEVMRAAKQSQENQGFSHIMDCYGKHKYPTFWDRIVPNRLKTIKVALISHLTLFASESSSSELSDQAFRLLSNLAVNDDTKQWRANPDIYESLLDALASVGAKRDPLRQDCLQMLLQMENSSIQNQQTVKEWRGLYSIEQKLDMKSNHEPEIPSQRLYDVVRNHLGMHLTQVSNLEHTRKLIEHYQNESFAKVSLLFDDVSERHIADFDFYIVMYELVESKKQVSNNTSPTSEDQMAHNQERSQWVQKPIHLGEICTRSSQRPFGPEERLKSVLILGNPGTGKTSLSKRICLDWTKGKWGSEFDRVYLLPVRQLTGGRLQLESTVEAAIGTLIFDADHKSEEERKALYQRIGDDLYEPKTLLIVDGLDEANGNVKAEGIVTDALCRSCSILVMSRPHNLGDLRLRVDAEIECLGLTSNQLKAYLRREVLNESEEFIQFLKRSPMVWGIARVPINAQILCTLWNSEVGQSLKESKSASLKSLYSSMTEYVWQRFVEKTREHVDRQSMFSSLEVIAFKSISQGRIEIPLDMVIKYAQGATTRKLLLDSGFLLFYKEGQVFQFVHLSFHEYFAGCFLAKNLRGTEKENKKARKYIAERKYYDNSRITMSFTIQCYCQEEEDDDEEDCINSLKQFLSILEENPVEVLGFQQTLLKMRTLDAFLSTCGNCTAAILSDDELKKVVDSLIKALDKWHTLEFFYHLRISIYDNRQDIYDHIMADLEQMPSLIAHFPEFLTSLLPHWLRGGTTVSSSRIGRLVSYSSDLVLQKVSKGLRDDDVSHGVAVDLAEWLKFFADSGPECAVLALEQLKTACQNQSHSIRSAACAAAVDFLKVFPDREDLHSLCRDAMKDTSADVRASFMSRLGAVTFEPNSVAANLAWTLALEATEDEDEKVRVEAYSSVVREDQTSAASIEKMIELLQEFVFGRLRDTYSYSSNEFRQRVFRVFARYPTKFDVFLLYLANGCNSPSSQDRNQMVEIIQHFALSLPTDLKRDLGEIISPMYCDFQDPEVRRGLVDALYDIEQKVPRFITDFPDVFSQICRDPDEGVRRLTKAREALRIIPSGKNVAAINEVFWEQSFGVKNELLRQIQRERMINEDTAEVVFEMVSNCLESRNYGTSKQNIELLSSLIQFPSLGSKVFRLMLKNSREINFAYRESIMGNQPLRILIEHFWATKDWVAGSVIGKKLLLASVTCKPTQGGRTIMSIVERGKKTELEAPTELVEEVISKGKEQLRRYSWN